MITLTDEGEFLLQEGSWILNAVQDLESRVRNIPKLDNNIRWRWTPSSRWRP